MHFLEVCFHYDKISETVPCCCHLKFASQMISHGNQAILIWRLKDDKESILCGWFLKAFDIEASKTHKKKQFWKHFTILQGSPKRWKIGVAETLTEYYCGSLFKVCNTETKYTLKLSSASRASRGAIFSKKKRIS